MMLTDLQIAQKAEIKKIEEIATKIGLTADDLELYGKYKAKVSFEAINRYKDNPRGKIVLVTAITPTKAGEGKSTTTIGLGDSIAKLGFSTMIALREPSLGPVMGVKGGAAGGGYAQVIPMEDINLHFTGDIHAITAANNLISAIIDNHLFHGNELKLNPEKIIWKRAMDMNDRSLRKIQVGLSMKKETPRFDAFDISVASEVMAVLCLATDIEDLKRRLSTMVVAYNQEDKPVTVGDLKATGAVAMLLKEAIKPNIVQTLEGTPALIHGGPFANIAHGCNSIIATDFASRAADFVVTEAGFGVDLGMEKFMDIKMRAMDYMPSAVVIVASLRALKIHGGVSEAEMNNENVEAVKKGLANLEKHIESVKNYQVPYIIALNKFYTDTDQEIEAIMSWAKSNNHEIALSEVFAKGSEGGLDLARKVVNKAIESKHNRPLYPLNLGIKDKINKIAKEIYGADGVIFTEKAEEQIEQFNKLGWDNLAICMAKTPLSLSDDADIKGRPSGFKVTVREFKPSIGAGFIVALTGAVMTMPGLPKHGAYENMDLIDQKIIGLF
ncbi:MAG: formate--tetrahydrofolate ligase [Candidatus Izemoplasmatales bacterium]|jgi:formate--tetrahydrofolate ligase|nr:formate--tetrahydrofolate ligase [Candidatus Izemoplasmatales bacterium]